MPNKSHLFDKALELKDAGAITASAAALVGGVAKVLDFGGASLEGSAGRIDGHIIANISAIDVADGNEKYEIEWQLSNDLFVAQTVVATVVKLGDSTVNNGTADSVAGRVEQMVSNEFMGTIYRYARLFHRIAGTTPSINYSAFLSKMNPR